MRLLDLMLLGHYYPDITDQFSRITNNNMLNADNLYLLRDRRNGFPHMDYIVHYNMFTKSYVNFHMLVEPFYPSFYKTPTQTEWTTIPTSIPLVDLFKNPKMFDMYGQILVPKSMINNKHANLETSATIYHLFKQIDYNIHSVKPEKIKRMISAIINRSLKENPSLINEIPRDLLQARVGGRRTNKNNRRRRRKTRKST